MYFFEITYRRGVWVARSTELGYARCHYARASNTAAPAFFVYAFMKTLLIVDEHPAVLEGLGSILRAEGYRIVMASSSRDALLAVNSGTHIDMMVSEVSLSSIHDSLGLIYEIRVLAGVPVVIYTMHGEMWNVRMIVDSGAEGIVLKNDSIDELMEAVRTVGNGGVYRSAAFSGRVDALKSACGVLSDKDMKVLVLISEGLGSKEIAVRMCLTEKAVEYHRSNILKKLGSNNMTQAINQALRLGIL